MRQCIDCSHLINSWQQSNMICISASRINADAPICKLVCAILGTLFTGTISNGVKGPNVQFCHLFSNT